MTESKKGLGQLLNESLNFFVQNFSRLVTVVTFVYIPLAVLYIVFFTGVDMQQIGVSKDIDFSGPASIKGLLYSIIMFLAAFLYQIALIKTIMSIENKEPAEPVDAYSSAFAIYWPVVLVGLLATLKIFLWSLLLIIPGIIFAIFYTFSVYAAIIEGKRGNDALRYSKMVVRSDMGKFIGNTAVAGIVTIPCMLVASIIITAVFGLKSAGNLGIMPTTGEALARFCTAVISVYLTIFYYFLYSELKRHINPETI